MYYEVDQPEIEASSPSLRNSRTLSDIQREMAVGNAFPIPQLRPPFSYSSSNFPSKKSKASLCFVLGLGCCSLLTNDAISSSKSHKNSGLVAIAPVTVAATAVPPWNGIGTAVSLRLNKFQPEVSVVGL
ncbi:hypothetical protein F2P56_019791 [Juglans regia]|uniref:Uncharacterized protein n=1 Tax=Juglans regia TaxID=51240 RepID=A0A833X4H5_JUGRE|nr:hypothetical protein F2P56_019791 [Juglans regia]